MGTARTRPQRTRTWIPAVVVVALLAGFFGVPPLARYLKAPNISTSFGTEDAVAALRLEARGVSYLVLVNEAGTTRSVRLAERGFEQSQMVWSEAGLSVGGPDDEYILHDDGLDVLPLRSANERAGERGRFATSTGFAVSLGSATGSELAEIDPSAKQVDVRDVGYAAPQLATCDGELTVVGDHGAQPVTDFSGDIEGFDVFDGVAELTCADDRLFGLSDLVDGPESRQLLRIWARAGGAPAELEIRYTEPALRSRPSSLFVRDGRPFWALDGDLWTVDRAGMDAARSGTPDDRPRANAVRVAELRERIAGQSPVVGTDKGVLDDAGHRVYGVMTDEEYVKRRRGASYRQLAGMSVFSVDLDSGASRVEISLDDIDFPERNLRVSAIAVNPRWAENR